MNVVAEMLLTDPAPAAIWATLILLTFPALLMLGSPEAMRHPGRTLRDLLTALRSARLFAGKTLPSPYASTPVPSAHNGSTRHLPTRSSSAGDVSSQHASSQHASSQHASSQHASSQYASSQYVSEVRVAAERAAVAAQRWQELWEQAEATVNAAYESWLDADARLRKAMVAARWGTPWSAPTCEEYAARERFLHRAVAVACDRGDLPAAALADALAGRNGWDARLHPVDQELVITKATVTYRRHCYDTAAAAELTARHDADLAHRAAGSLAREALAAPFTTVPSPATPAPGRRPMVVPA
ncbi:hypothetical protein [Paractinoplanes brasiliensis]|uniref:Uncharacterized protein n=1 Tax=Paractinoplanes brasiliensis TaxID=52695 RepID=A0A4R6JAE1_9ACTN|nr:hypothetical protein [Actinoplanes brasiliensis]TDO32653.1 hypothetical protein C8E87_8123 [Actinoplanes brasiliensis]GID32785.1 hypothetical protein Abr02nite_77680 [Actinoplanes brasiliensis]